MNDRVTSNFANRDGVWSYSVTVDGEVVASGDDYTDQQVMQAHMARDLSAAQRNLEAREAAERVREDRRPAVLLLAPTGDLAAASVELVRLLLKLPAHIEVAPMQPFSEVPEGLQPVGLVSLGLDFADDDLHRWALDRVLPRLSRRAVFAGIESSVYDLVPPGGRHLYPFSGL